MKIYVITISDVYDYDEDHREPIVRLNRADAVKKFNELRLSAEECYKNQYDKKEYTKDSSFSFYKDGYYATNHYNVQLHEIEVEAAFPLEIIFGEEAVEMVEEKGFGRTLKKLENDSVSGAHEIYQFETEADRTLATRMLCDADGWFGSIWRIPKSTKKIRHE